MNGGLLVGAVMNQRPDLFRAAVPQVGVMDMLRFHKFTIGWAWAPITGRATTPRISGALRVFAAAQHPPGARYPATLIVTADHDDRVVPAHSFKYAATLQARASRESPRSSASKRNPATAPSNTAKLIEVTADIYAFIL